MATAYTIQAGDTLSGIAGKYRVGVDQIFNANPNNPALKSKDLIIAGGNITIPDAIATGQNAAAPSVPTITRPKNYLNTPVKEEIPGIGTLTRTPKSPIAGAAPAPAPDLMTNSAGLYERTGVTPPPTIQPNTPSGATVDPVTGKMISPAPGAPTTPTYGPTGPSKAATSITDAYNSLLKSITDIESKITSSATPTEEEKKLSADLAAKKAALATFDVQSLKAAEDLYGQGRGRTLSNIAIEETQTRRTRALERLGLATEAQIIADQLGLKQDERKALGDAATTQYNLATKRLDISLGLSKELRQLDEDEKTNARQYLLDVVDFAEGKSFDELDQATQDAIMRTVANSPITIDMVKTALKRGAAGKESELLTVSEAKDLGVPYGTKRGEAFGITPAGADGEGGYTSQEKRRLREAGIDPTDTKAADRYLYGDNAKRGVLTVEQLNAIADALYKSVGDAKDSQFETLEDLKSYLKGESVVDVNDQKVILTDIQKDTIDAQIDSLVEQNRGFFSKLGTGLKGLIGR